MHRKQDAICGCGAADAQAKVQHTHLLAACSSFHPAVRPKPVLRPFQESPCLARKRLSSPPVAHEETPPPLSEAQLRQLRQAMEASLTYQQPTASPVVSADSIWNPNDDSICEPISSVYKVAAGGLGAMALATPVIAECTVLSSTALALLCDMGPSSARDVTSSIRARDAAMQDALDASPPMVLVDNFVHNVGPRDIESEEKKAEALQRMGACNTWALCVRGRVLSDAIGVGLMLRGQACLGAALMLLLRALVFAPALSAARVDATRNTQRPGSEDFTSPTNPRAAAAVNAATVTLAVLAAWSSLGWNGHIRTLSSRLYAGSLSAIALARQAQAHRSRRRRTAALAANRGAAAPALPPQSQSN